MELNKGTSIKRKYEIFDGFTIKCIAVISMIIDHFGGIIMDGVLSPYRINGYIVFNEKMPFMVFHSGEIRNICEILGSIAFPIFCFLIVEGFIHTRSRVKYGIRMAAFALISEIPYNIAHYSTLFNPRLQNVMFTLCVGIFTLLAISIIEKKMDSCKWKKYTLIAVTILAGMALAFIIRGEYVFLGVAAISLFYLFRGNKYLQLLGFAPLLIVSPWILLAVIPVVLYNGKKGLGLKYFFYVFYPVHFLLFAGISYLLANR